MEADRELEKILSDRLSPDVPQGQQYKLTKIITLWYTKKRCESLPEIESVGLYNLAVIRAHKFCGQEGGPECPNKKCSS